MKKLYCAFFMLILVIFPVYPMLVSHKGKGKDFITAYQTKKVQEKKLTQDYFESLGTLPFILPLSDCKPMPVNCKPSKDQKLFLLVSQLPTDLQKKLLLHHILENNDTAVLTLFTKQPCGKTLEWLSLLIERRKNDSYLAQNSSLADLFILKPKNLIILADTIKYFSDNKTSVIYRSPEMSSALSQLPDSIKQCQYFQDKWFIQKEDFYDRNRNLCHIFVLASTTIPLALLSGIGCAEGTNHFIPNSGIDLLINFYNKSCLNKTMIALSGWAVTSYIPLIFLLQKLDVKLQNYHYVRYEPQRIWELTEKSWFSFQ